MKKELLEKLEEKVWYRTLKALSIILLLLAFFSPWFIQEPSFYLIFDGLLNVAIWGIIVFLLRRIIVYVVFGSQKSSEAERKEKKEKSDKFAKKFGLVLLGIFLLVFWLFSISGIVVFIVNLIKGDWPHQWIWVIFVFTLLPLSSILIYRINREYRKL